MFYICDFAQSYVYVLTPDYILTPYVPATALQDAASAAAAVAVCAAAQREGC